MPSGIVRTSVKKVIVGAYQVFIRYLKTDLKWYFCSGSVVYICGGQFAVALASCIPVSKLCCVNAKSSVFRIVGLLLLMGWCRSKGWKNS